MYDTQGCASRGEGLKLNQYFLYHRGIFLGVFYDHLC